MRFRQHLVITKINTLQSHLVFSCKRFVATKELSLTKIETDGVTDRRARIQATLNGVPVCPGEKTENAPTQSPEKWLFGTLDLGLFLSFLPAYRRGILCIPRVLLCFIKHTTPQRLLIANVTPLRGFTIQR